ncbi:MAG: arginine deiminase family protein, partial [Actinomycetia bacterium]|nr:arginine deiminase family protein [Actinomycetes bacterium]
MTNAEASSIPSNSGHGVYSEVGKLRKVIVHRPGQEMRRLTPSNAHDLLFEDVIWARKAREEHDAFVEILRDDFDVNVMHIHDLLADVVTAPVGRSYVLDRKLTPNEVGVNGSLILREWMDELDAATLVQYLIGGITVDELPPDLRSPGLNAWESSDFVLPPLPNQLFARDSSSWIYN